MVVLHRRRCENLKSKHTSSSMRCHEVRRIIANICCLRTQSCV
jgi:hypothetical protein